MIVEVHESVVMVERRRNVTWTRSFGFLVHGVDSRPETDQEYILRRVTETVEKKFGRCRMVALLGPINPATRTFSVGVEPINDYAAHHLLKGHV